MKKLSQKKNQISRRKILPILGSSFLIPLFGFGNVTSKKSSVSDNEKYEILLKPDGTTVKVKSSNLKDCKKVKQNISNKSFYNWLKKI